jgi:hypothetical protein
MPRKNKKAGDGSIHNSIHNSIVEKLNRPSIFSKKIFNNMKN